MARKRNEARSLPSPDAGTAAAPKRRRTAERTKSEVAPAEAPVPTLAAPAEPTVNPMSAPPAYVASAQVAVEEPPVAANGQSAAATALLDEHEEIARLAYSYWEARGCQGGSPEEDWHRASEEVRRRRAGTAE